jgi:LPS export ABC transporter protein LptC
MVERRRTLALLLIGLFTAGSLFLCMMGCGGEAPEPAEVPQAAVEEPDQVFLEPHMVITEGGVTKAILESGTVEVWEDRNYTALKDSVRIRFFNEKGAQTSTLTSSSGEIWGLYEEVDSLHAAGDVLVRSFKRDVTLTSESLRWNRAAGLVYADDFAEIRTPQGYEQGYGFEAKDDLTEYQFRRQVRGEYHGAEQDTTDGGK